MNPPNNRRLPGSPAEWFVHAQSDLSLARTGRDQKDVLPEQICFHAQQTVEKALKAILLAGRVDFPLTHDLEEILEIVEQCGIAIPAEIGQVGLLTPYAVEARYPGYSGAISSEDVDEAIRLAEQVLAWARLAVR